MVVFPFDTRGASTVLSLQSVESKPTIIYEEWTNVDYGECEARAGQTACADCKVALLSTHTKDSRTRQSRLVMTRNEGGEHRHRHIVAMVTRADHAKTCPTAVKIIVGVGPFAT